MPIHCEAKHTIACHLIRYLLINSLNGDCVTHEYTTSCRARDQAWPTNWIQTLVAAAAISSATASGFEAKGVWSTGKETTLDFILAAVNRCVSGDTMRSFSAIRNQVGFSLQAGLVIGSPRHFKAIGF